MAESEKPEANAEVSGEEAAKAAPKKKAVTKKKVATKKKAATTKKAASKKRVVKSEPAKAAAAVVETPKPSEPAAPAKPAEAPAAEVPSDEELARREALRKRLASAGVMNSEAPKGGGGPTLADRLFKLVVLAGVLAIAWFFYLESEKGAAVDGSATPASPVGELSGGAAEPAEPADGGAAFVASSAGDAQGEEAVGAAEEPERSLADSILSAVLVGRGAPGREAVEEPAAAESAPSAPEAVEADPAGDGSGSVAAGENAPAAATGAPAGGAGSVVAAAKPASAASTTVASSAEPIPSADGGGGEGRDDGLYYPDFGPAGGYYYGPVYYYNPWYSPGWGPWGPGWW